MDLCLQEAYRHDEALSKVVDASVLYREGASSIYPRALLFDARGSLGHVPVLGAEEHGEDSAAGAAGQQSWTSFCQARFHRRSVHEVGQSHAASALDSFPGGLDWAGMDADAREAAEEGARWHLEDSDYLDVSAIV